MSLGPRRFGRRKAEGNGIIRSSIHRRFLRTFICAVFNNDGTCDERHAPDVAHVRTPNNAGMGRKPSDEWSVPLCRTHHRRAHQIGDKAFEIERGISLIEKAKEFARASRDPAIKAAAKMM